MCVGGRVRVWVDHGEVFSPVPDPNPCVVGWGVGVYGGVGGLAQGLGGWLC